MLVRFPNVGGTASISLLRKSNVLRRGILCRPDTFNVLMWFSLAMRISRPCNSYTQLGMNWKLRIQKEGDNQMTLEDIFI